MIRQLPARTLSTVSSALLVAVLLAAMLVLVTAPGAEAAPLPSGAETAEDWTVSGTTAEGTSPSGVDVTVQLTGGTPALGFTPAATGDLMSISGGGPRPDFIPENDHALLLQQNGCTDDAVDGCGTITYTFSEPVSDPVLYVSSVGAANPFGSADGFFHSPITVDGHTFALLDEGPDSQTADPPMEIRGAGATIGVDGPQATNAQDGTCENFGCGAYQVITGGPVTELVFDWGYEGSISGEDYVGMLLSFATPPPPAPAMEMVKSGTPSADPLVAGSTIDYSFTVTNTGNVALSDLEITDDKVGPVTCETTDLEPTDEVVCTADDPYTVTAADATAGEVVNVATATALDPDGGSVEAEDTVTFPVATPAAPATPAPAPAARPSTASPTFTG